MVHGPSTTHKKTTMDQQKLPLQGAGGLSITTANTLFNDGVFNAMYKAGFITDKVFLYREIYLWIQAQVQTRGINRRRAVLEAEEKFKKTNAPSGAPSTVLMKSKTIYLYTLPGSKC